MENVVNSFFQIKDRKMSLILREARIRSSIGYQCYVNGWGSIAMPNRHLTIPDDVFPLHKS